MSSDPFFRRIIHNAWKSIALPRSQYEGNLPLSSPSSVTRMRSFTLALPQSHGSDRLPLYYAKAVEKEKLDYHPKSPSSLSTKIVCLTFAALWSQNQIMPASKDQRPILGAAMIIAFAASFSVMFISHSYPRLAAIVKKIGYLFFALSFLLMTRIFFSESSMMWTIIVGLALAWNMLALLRSLFK